MENRMFIGGMSHGLSHRRVSGTGSSELAAKKRLLYFFQDGEKMAVRTKTTSRRPGEMTPPIFNKKSSKMRKSLASRRRVLILSFRQGQLA
jgi:hypothetical protein